MFGTKWLQWLFIGVFVCCLCFSSKTDMGDASSLPDNIAAPAVQADTEQAAPAQPASVAAMPLSYASDTETPAPADTVPPTEPDATVPAGTTAPTDTAPAETPSPSDTPAPPPQTPQYTLFNKNLYLDNVDLSRYSYYSANVRFGIVSDMISRGFEVTLIAGSAQYTITASDIGLKSNYAALLKQLWDYSQTKPDSYEGMRLHTNFTYDSAKAQSAVDKIVAEVCPDAPGQSNQTPDFDFDSRTFVVPNEMTFDADSLRAQLTQGIADAVSYACANDAAPKSSLTAEPAENAQAASLLAQYGKISTYTTYTTNGASQADRNTNIMLATEAISGTVLDPGDVFSFLGTVGDTTEAKGYKVAGILVNGKHDTGLGGGICQV
ncbi:MAG: VanW family protein, partial [Defluviitaleaceae bacterium]|nr:VanW family protein [Defluviitaleaceae bacterium]